MLENNVMAVFVQGNYLRSYILAFERRFFSLYLSVWKKIVLCEIVFPNLIARFVCFFFFVFFVLPVQILGTKAKHTGRCQKSLLGNSADCVFLDWVTGLKYPEDSWNFIYIMFFSVQAFPPHHGSVASTIKHLAVLYRKQVRKCF